MAKRAPSAVSEDAELSGAPGLPKKAGPRSSAALAAVPTPASPADEKASHAERPVHFGIAADELRLGGAPDVHEPIHQGGQLKFIYVGPESSDKAESLQFIYARTPPMRRAR